MADTATRELIIRIKGEVSQSMKQAAAAAKADIEKVDAAAKKAAEAQAKEAKKAADALAREAKRAAEAAERETKKAADATAREAKRAADAQTREAKKATDAAEREAKRSADAAEREANRAAVAKIKADKKAFDASFVSLQSLQSAALDTMGKIATEQQKLADAEEKRRKKSLTNEEVNLLAKNKLVQAANQKRIDSAAEAMDTEKKGLDESTSLTEKLSNAVGSVAGQFTLLSAAQAVMRGIAQATDEANRSQEKYAQTLLRTKEDLKELATLKGFAFADDKFLKEMSQFSRATGLSFTDAEKFQTQVYGSAAAGLEKGNIDEDTLKKLTVRAGMTAARQTKDYSTRGDLIGVLSQFRKYDKGDAGVRQAMGDAEAVRKALEAGRGTDSELTKSLLHVAGSLAGEGKMVGSLPELAAVVGATSLSAGPGMADTRTEQLVRGLRGETPQQTAFMKQFAGIGENDNLETRLDKIVPKLREQRSKGREISAFLNENGVNAEQSRAIVEAESNYESIKKRMADARRASTDIDAQDRAFRADPAGKMRMAEADAAIASIEQGKRTQLFEVAKKEAEAASIRSGEKSSIWYNLGNMGLSALNLGRDGETVRTEQRALRMLRRRAGFNPDKAPYNFGSQTEEAEYYQDVIDANNQRFQKEMQGRRIDPVPKLLEKQNAILQQGLMPGGVPPPLPAAPPPAMKRL